MFFEEKRGSKGQYYIKEVDLFEGSIVVIPANPKAESFVKSLFDVEKHEQVESEDLKADEVSIEDRIKNIKKMIVED